MPETAPRFNSEFYKAVFYTINSPTLIIDTSFVICDANQAAVTFLEYDSREQLIGTDVETILVNSDLLTEVTEQILSKNRWEGETEIKTRNNRILTGIGSAVPLQPQEGEQVIVGVFSDLTERRRYTSSLKILNRVMRHNLRTEANILIGHLEHLRSAVDEKHHESIDAIYDILEHLLDRAQTARELENLLRNDNPASLTVVRLDRHLERVLTRAEQQYSGVELEYELEPANVIGSEAVSTVFDEVIENAIEHNDSETPRVEISMTTADETVTVTIADNGPGIPVGNENRIFGREEIDELHHGDGFGLFVVDQAMKAYGGKVWVEQNEPRGATFKLQFPRSS